MTRWSVAFVVLGLLIATGPVAGQTPAPQRVPVDGGGHYTDVSPGGLAAMLQKKNFPLINVHVPYEGEIQETDLFIAFDRIQADLAQLPADKGARIVLYCRSGSMSATAARTLVKLGYLDVWNLDGGLIAWKQGGHPVVSKAR